MMSVSHLIHDRHADRDVKSQRMFVPNVDGIC